MKIEATDVLRILTGCATNQLVPIQPLVASKDALTSGVEPVDVGCVATEVIIPANILLVISVTRRRALYSHTTLTVPRTRLARNMTMNSRRTNPMKWVLEL
jgi:hypothetical protein